MADRDTRNSYNERKDGGHIDRIQVINSALPAVPVTALSPHGGIPQDQAGKKEEDLREDTDLYGRHLYLRKQYVEPA